WSASAAISPRVSPSRGRCRRRTCAAGSARGSLLSTEPMSYFQAVRLYSLVEVCIFTSLIVTAIGGFSEQAELVLGWTHGFGWIFLCLLVANGCRKRIFPWWLLGATVSPLGPIGSSAGLEYLARHRPLTSVNEVLRDSDA